VGGALLSNGVPQVVSIPTADGVLRVTNVVAVTWSSTNTFSSPLATNTLVRPRVWDGRYWSAAVTSQPFVVDNEAPTSLPALSVSSHTAGSWSSNRIMQAQWSPASDGQGVGIAGYGVLFTDSVPVAPLSVTTSGLAMASDPLTDGSNWWVAVRAIDAFGNAGADTSLGGFRIDASAPSAASAVVDVVKDELGNYVVGTVVTSSWSGFSDAMSGIAGYYFAVSNAAPSSNGGWTAGQTAGLEFDSGVLDATNYVYVWARDQVGRIGSAAWSAVLLLDPGQDYDQDGHTTAEEVISGTDASSAESVLRFIAATNSVASNQVAVVLRWPSAVGRTYALHQRPTLTNGTWLALAGHTNLAGIGGIIVRTNTYSQAEARFYRISVTMP